MSEEQQNEQQNGVPGRRHGGPGDAAVLYRLAYEEGKRALDDQVDELNGIRGRAVQFTAFVGSSTAFLAAVGLRTGPDRSWLFYVLAGVASALSLFAIASLGFLLIPRKRQKFTFKMSSRVLIEDWIECEVPGPSEAAMLKELATEYDDLRVKNSRALGVLRRWYASVILIGATAVVVWAGLAWAGGAPTQ